MVGIGTDGVGEGWVSGVFTCNVTVTGSATDVTISTAALADMSRNGTSNPFDVEYAIVYSEYPEYELLGGGARWAARDGETALYLNWMDSWLNHYTTDGSDWSWHDESIMDYWKNSITQTLEEWGFEVTCLGDMPETLNDFDLIVIDAFYTVEPSHAPLLEEYISDGGGVVITGAVPCYLSVYCRDWWPGRLGGTDLTSIQDWLGCSRFVNTGGTARIVFDNPVGTSFSVGDIVHSTDSPYDKAVTNLNSNAETIATWDPSTYVYSYTYEYGEGRVFYHGGTFPIIPTP